MAFVRISVTRCHPCDMTLCIILLTDVFDVRVCHYARDLFLTLSDTVILSVTFIIGVFTVSRGERGRAKGVDRV